MPQADDLSRCLVPFRLEWLSSNNSSNQPCGTSPFTSHGPSVPSLRCA